MFLQTDRKRKTITKHELFLNVVKDGIQDCLYKAVSAIDLLSVEQSRVCFLDDLRARVVDM